MSDRAGFALVRHRCVRGATTPTGELPASKRRLLEAGIIFRTGMQAASVEWGRVGRRLELHMRQKLTLVIAAIAAAVTFTLPTPAAAVDKAGALKACGQNRNCGIIPGTAVGGGVDLVIKDDNGKTTAVVICPPKGECTLLRTTDKKLSVRQTLVGNAGLAPSQRTSPKPNLGPGILETGSGFNANAPSGAGSPVGGGAPSSPKGPVFQ